jgi:hypothetical protein
MIDRAQGFLEWGAQGLLRKSSGSEGRRSARTFFLGDGGMNGIELTTAMRHGSIEVHYRPPVHSRHQGLRRPARSHGCRDAPEGGRWAADPGCAVQKDTKRRARHFAPSSVSWCRPGISRRIRSMKCCGAGIRPTRWPPSGGAQQEEASLNVYQAPAELSQSQRTVQPEQSQRSVPPLEYEEIGISCFYFGRLCECRDPALSVQRRSARGRLDGFRRHRSKILECGSGSAIFLREMIGKAGTCSSLLKAEG